MNDEQILRTLQASLRDRIAAGDPCGPFYTGNFDATYDDILEGCTALLKAI